MTSETITEANFVDLLLAAAPELKPVVEEHLSDMENELVLHLLMSDIREFTAAGFAAGNADLTGKVLAFIDHALSAGDDRVDNAVAVSFVEDSAWWEPGSADFIASWPDGLRAEAERQRNWRPGKST